MLIFVGLDFDCAERVLRLHMKSNEENIGKGHSGLVDCNILLYNCPAEQVVHVIFPLSKLPSTLGTDGIGTL